MEQKRSPLPEKDSRSESSREKIPPARYLVIVLNLILIAGLLLLPARIIPSVQRGLRSGAASLDALSSTFDRITSALSASTTALQSTSEALERTSRSIEKSTAVLDSASAMIGDIGGRLIEPSQRALDGMEGAASGIDRTMDLLDAIGLLGQSGGQEPLADSIQELNRMLDTWPEEFEELGGSLSQVSGDVDGLTASLEEIQRDLDEFQSEIQILIGDLDELSGEFKDTSRGLTLWAERVPVLSWSFFGVLALLLGVRTWIRASELLKHRQGEVVI